MPRLIDANEILKSEHQHYDYWSDEYYVTVRDIENAPTVDAEPVKHGHWINDFSSPLKCSSCGIVSKANEFTLRRDFKFCPYCGAKMDEVINE